MPKKWIVPITGFTQSIDRPNGFDSLWHKLRELPELDGSSSVVMTPQEWSASFGHIANFIHRHKNGSEEPLIYVFAYSWGCGRGFIRLAKELKKRGMSIQHAVLCDPVFHSWARIWRSMVFSPAIKIPSNVHRVSWFRQKQNRPRATELVATGKYTVIDQPIWLKRSHEWMDDAPEFHEKCLEVCR